MNIVYSHSSTSYFDVIFQACLGLYSRSIAFMRADGVGLLSGGIIVLNAVLIGIEIEVGRIDADVDERVPWYVIQNIVTTLFCVEFIIRVRTESIYGNLWNLMDLFLLLMSITSTWILALLVPSAGATLNVLSTSIRLIRILTVGRLIKIFISSNSLWLIVSGFVDAIRTLFWVSILVIFILYACAVFVTITIGQDPLTYEPYKIFSGGWDYQEYFGSVPRSMLTLFQIITFDDWANGIARHVMSNQPAMAIFFILFILITSYGILNVVVGIIVERTLASAKVNEERSQRNQEKERTRVLHDLREIFEFADKDKSGALTIDEFRSALRQPEVERKLKVIDLPVSDAEELFNVLDGDGSGELSVEEFIGGCIRLKGPAKSKDLLAVQVCIKSLTEKLDTIDEILGMSETNLTILEQRASDILHASQKNSNQDPTNRISRSLSHESRRGRCLSPNSSPKYSQQSLAFIQYLKRKFFRT